MLAPLATLAFLATLWLVVVVAARTLEESGVKIAAALAGRSLLAVVPNRMRVETRLRVRYRPTRPLRAEPKLRAAA
jgi:hypothetical protein